jgi:uncharacterized protein (TIGR00290 family)
MTEPHANEPIACSWSGGKDCCLALHRLVQQGYRPAALVTMFTEEGNRTRSHGLPRDVIEAQARSIGCPLISASATWAGYEACFGECLTQVKKMGIEQVVFGDIDLEEHRLWEERVCATAGLTAVLPLWQAERMSLLEEWWSADFAATIVAVRQNVLPQSLLGRSLDRQTVEQVVAAGADACGEKGEYHTLAIAGPLFQRPLQIKLLEQVVKADCWFQDTMLVTGDEAAHSLAPQTFPSRR